jgi:putative ABC transport system permease protein
VKLPIVLTIALRNVREHKSKSIIIGVLVTVGVAALVVGNSVMDSAAEGIRDAYIRTYTGELVIAGSTEDSVSLFGQTGGPQGTSLPPTIDRYVTVRDFLLEHEAVEGVSPQVHGNAIISVDEEQAGFGVMFGIQPERYREAFPDNLVLEDGRFLEGDEEGIVLNSASRESLEESADRELEIGDALLLTGLSQTAGTRIREVVIRGFFHFEESNAQLDNVSLVDAQTMRALNAMNVSPVEAVELSETERRLLSDFDEEELFGSSEEGGLFGGSITEEGDGELAEGSASEPGAQSRGPRTEEELLNIFGDLPDRPAESDNATAWHFLVVRAESPGAVSSLAADIRNFLSEEGIEAQVLDWQQAAGPTATFSQGIQVALNVGIILVAVVAVIIIMNTLVISVTERVGEIGTMRAIGAHKQFVRRMILSETAVLTLSFGLLGVVIGSGILGIISALGIEAGNEFLRLIFGGDVLRPALSGQAVLTALIGVMLAGLLASLYPTRIALNIQPVVAMQGK